MRTATLIRQKNQQVRTFGSITLDSSGLVFRTLERPWIENANDVSSIPLGTYLCVLLFSPEHKANLYHVSHVKDRTEIEIHSANWVWQLKGCIAVGKTVELIENPQGIMEPGISESREALAEFMADLNGEPFQLTITQEA